MQQSTTIAAPLTTEARSSDVAASSTAVASARQAPPLTATIASAAAPVVAAHAATAPVAAVGPRCARCARPLAFGLHAASTGIGWVIGVWTLAALAPAMDAVRIGTNGFGIPLMLLLMGGLPEWRKRRCLARGQTPPSQFQSFFEWFSLATLCSVLALLSCKAAHHGGDWLATSYPAVDATRRSSWKAFVAAVNVGACAMLATEGVCVWQDRRRVAGNGRRRPEHVGDDHQEA